MSRRSNDSEARQQQRRRGGDHDDDHQLLLDRYVAEIRMPHALFFNALRYTQQLGTELQPGAFRRAFD